MSESTLATYRNLSPNYSTRQGTISAISIHCTAGNKNNTARQIVDGVRFVRYDPAAGASTTYAVGGDGSIAQGLSEGKRQWCTSSKIDHRCVTIEVASNMDGTQVTEAAYQSLILLCVDICRRNGIPALRWDPGIEAKNILKNWNSHPNWYERVNLIPHRYFAAKACPGDWLFSRFGQIAAEVNKRLAEEQKEDDDMDIEKLTDEQAYIILQKAARYEANLPEPDWSKQEGHWKAAEEKGVMDGTRPEAAVKRCELAAVLGRKKLL